MKFIYVDESGGRDQSDVFVMVGLLVDAYRLRRKTTDFDELLKDLLHRHPGRSADHRPHRPDHDRGPRQTGLHGDRWGC